MSETISCACQGTAHDEDCWTRKPAHTYDLNLYFLCPAGGHEWLPWARLDSGALVTRCIHCKREERIES